MHVLSLPNNDDQLELINTICDRLQWFTRVVRRKGRNEFSRLADHLNIQPYEDEH